MTRINILDDSLISKIAAGEVIERPASVVKELVENALDARCTQIVVRISEGGKRSISVTDNGQGIPSDELHLALLRHATSKIHNVDDLFNIHTLGFRGEALASIDAVSDCTVISKPADQPVAMQIRAGVISAAAHENGTTVVVNDLFGKIPARKKYLKTPPTETRIIHELIEHYALCHPAKGWKLFCDNELAFHAPEGQNRLERARSVLGRSLGRNLVEISSGHHAQNACKVGGVLALPPTMSSNRKHQHIFCNGRLIQSAAVSAALEHGFKGLIPLHHHPVAILFLEVEPKAIDVNVHPAKTTVRFLEESSVYRAVFHAIEDTLKSHHLLQEHSLQATPPPQQSLIQPPSSPPVPLPPSPGGHALETGSAPPQQPFTSSKYYGFSTARQHMLHAADQPMIRDSSVGQQPLPQTAAFPSERTTNMSSPSFKVLDIINKTFVIASTPEGLTITDFHAAYERLNYEVLKKKFEENAVDVQQLLSPFIYETTSRIHNDALTNAAALASFGIIVEDFGPQTLQITHLPIILGRRVEPSIIEDVIEDIVAGSSASLDRKKDIILQRMACKASPRAGDTILFQEAATLIEHLYTHQLTWTCPHGRPVMVLVSVDSLAKMFHR